MAPIDHPLERADRRGEGAGKRAIQREDEKEGYAHHQGEAQKQGRPDFRGLGDKQPVKSEKHHGAGNEKRPEGRGGAAAGALQPFPSSIEPVIEFDEGLFEYRGFPGAKRVQRMDRAYQRHRGFGTGLET